MADGWLSCKACSQSDPTQDTVKVNPKLLNKENLRPLLYSKEMAEEQRRREVEEEAGRRRKEETATAAAAEIERREASERARREAEDTRRRDAEEATLREIAEMEQREAEERGWENEAVVAARAAKAADDAVKQAAEEDRRQREAFRIAEEQARIEREEAEKKVGTWCKKHGYTNVNTQKKTFRGATKFPLHTAVKYNEQEMIHALLLVGAQKDVKDSKSQTPSELAQKMNKAGSHDQALAMLS